MNTDDTHDDVIEKGQRVLDSITECVDRGEGRGKCHVFLDGSGICACKKIDLNRYRREALP